MATFQDGGRRRATANTVTSMRRSAEKRRCPKCKRKSALKFASDDFGYGHFCRWEDCDYSAYRLREEV